MNNQIKLLITVGYIPFLLLCFTSCAKDPIDKLLDKTETVIGKWEIKADDKSLSETDILKMQDDLEEATKDMQNIEIQNATAAQKTRMEKLQSRLVKMVWGSKLQYP